MTVFEHTPAAGDAGDVVSEAISGPSPLRTCPILRDAQGRRFLVHGGIGIHGVREALEERLKKLPASWETYQKCRGAYLERSALEILSNILPDATVRLNLKYFGPSPKSNEAAGEPSRSGEWRAYNDVGQIVEARPGRASPAPA